MTDKQNVIEKIIQAFGENEYPGDHFIQGSTEGSEPYEEVGPFAGLSDWQKIPVDFLDAHAGALSFFSEAGFRFFLPAYLIADLNGQLRAADPLFHVTHGFYDIQVELPAGGRTFIVTSGKSALINPRRYGAATAYDYARYRLSVFTREEAGAIVAYLENKRQSSPVAINRQSIEAALNLFWLEREQNAPTAESLAQHIREQAEYLDAIHKDRGTN